MEYIYLYGMLKKSFGQGNQPKKGFVGRCDSNVYCDILVYSRPLEEEEIDKYDLVYLSKQPAKKQ